MGAKSLRYVFGGIWEFIASMKTSCEVFKFEMKLQNQVLKNAVSPNKLPDLGMEYQ